MRPVAFTTILALATSARADATADDPEPPNLTPKPEYGADVRARALILPRALLEAFFDHAPRDFVSGGFGVDLVRRRANFEIQLGLEFDYLTVPEGVWVTKNSPTLAPGGAQQSTVDFILDPSHAGRQLGWFTIETTFVKHVSINRYLAFRYGAGAGVAIVTGGLAHYNVFCSAGAAPKQLEPQCVPPIAPFNGTATFSHDQGMQPPPLIYDLPPLLPILNAIVGLQVRPLAKMVVNFEAGLRSVPFVGISAGYFR